MTSKFEVVFFGYSTKLPVRIWIWDGVMQKCGEMNQSCNLTVLTQYLCSTNSVLTQYCTKKMEKTEMNENEMNFNKDKNMVEHKGPRVYDYKNLGA